MARRRRERPPAGAGMRVLDLHGLRADEARARTERWLRQQAAEGQRLVEVVTGRGTRSTAGPVLPGEIAHLLHTLSGELVQNWEPLARGGGMRVRLCAPSPSPDPAAHDRAASARLARAYPAALRRRAEESLAELGVTPTPALLEAEIRRLLEQDPPGAERRS